MKVSNYKIVASDKFQFFSYYFKTNFANFWQNFTGSFWSSIWEKKLQSRYFYKNFSFSAHKFAFNRLKLEYLLFNIKYSITFFGWIVRFIVEKIIICSQKVFILCMFCHLIDFVSFFQKRNDVFGKNRNRHSKKCALNA